MVYVKFRNSKKMVECTVIPVSDNVVTLEFSGTMVVNESGFDVFMDPDGEYDLGSDSYRGFKTIYRNDEVTAETNSYQLSNDKSVYVAPPEPEPEPEPEPYVPTLEDVKMQKVSEMNWASQETIMNGINVTLTDGTIEHFTLSDDDQIHLIGLRMLAAQGMQKIPWHTSEDNMLCKYYSNEDMVLITTSALKHVMFQVTYCKDLINYIESLQTKEDVEDVYYGMIVPVEYQSTVLADLYAAQD